MSNARQLARKLLTKLGWAPPVGRETHKNRSVVTVPADRQPAAGRVLLSYVIDPFLFPDEGISNNHTHFWESHAIARTFTERGYDVDVIHFENHTFNPEHDYNFFISARTNFDSIKPRLNQDCVSVVHLDTAHWLFNNTAAYHRLSQLRQRRGIALYNAKTVEPNWALEGADMGTVLGNQFTMDTYRFAGKPLHRIPISAPLVYDWQPDKDYSDCRSRFIWFGSSGFVHKGLDLVLEAFAGMPELELYVCGPLDHERMFVECFHRELYETPNIKTLGWVDVAGEEFLQLVSRCIGLVYPTCSEGGGGGVITCMHAGLIPIVTREASVDLGGGGIELGCAEIEEIRQQVRTVAGLPEESLEQLRQAAWQTARSKHTRAGFAQAFGEFVDQQLLNS